MFPYTFSKDSGRVCRMKKSHHRSTVSQEDVWIWYFACLRTRGGAVLVLEKEKDEGGLEYDWFKEPEVRLHNVKQGDRAMIVDVDEKMMVVLKVSRG